MKKSVTKTLFLAAALLSIVAGLIVGARYYDAGPAASAGSKASVAVDIGGQRFLRWESPRELPALSFQDQGGKTLTLADFSGRVVLLNIWATWCPPCRKEMPSLDRLNAKRGGPAFEVVALSIDHDATLVKPFYDEVGIKTLHGYFDPKARAMTSLGVVAVPTTLLIDRNGRELGRALGEAEWDSAQVEALIDGALALPLTKN